MSLSASLGQFDRDNTHRNPVVALLRVSSVADDQDSMLEVLQLLRTRAVIEDARLVVLEGVASSVHCGCNWTLDGQVSLDEEFAEFDVVLANEAALNLVVDGEQRLGLVEGAGAQSSLVRVVGLSLDALDGDHARPRIAAVAVEAGRCAVNDVLCA